MKLSEAIVLGSATVRLDEGNWNVCALGAAANAVGIPTDVIGVIFGVSYEVDGRADKIKARWPWLTGKQRCKAFNCPEDAEHDEVCDCITDAFDLKVCHGKMTFTQLVSLVKKVEPRHRSKPTTAAIDEALKQIESVSV